MKKLFPILFAFCFVFCFSQERRISFEEKQKIKEDSIVQSIQSKLKEKGIEEYFYLRDYLGDNNFIFTENDYEEHFSLECFNQYFIWKENNYFFIQKVDRKTNQVCAYKKIQINGKSLFKFIDKNLSKFNSEQIKFKPYEFLDKENNIHLSEKIPTKLTIFRFNDKEVVSFETRWIETFELKPNINHKHNQSLKIVQLYNKCEKIISELEEKNLFVEEK